MHLSNAAAAAHMPAAGQYHNFRAVCFVCCLCLLWVSLLMTDSAQCWRAIWKMAGCRVQRALADPGLLPICLHCYCLQLIGLPGPAYLDMFAAIHQLHRHIQFNTKVLSATPVTGSSGSSSSNGAAPTAAANGSAHTDGIDSSRPPQWRLTTLCHDPDSQALGLPQEQVGGLLCLVGYIACLVHHLGKVPIAPCTWTFLHPKCSNQHAQVYSLSIVCRARQQQQLMSAGFVKQQRQQAQSLYLLGPVIS